VQYLVDIINISMREPSFIRRRMEIQIRPQDFGHIPVAPVFSRDWPASELFSVLFVDSLLADLGVCPD
jgi:hypothetical protein